MSACVPGQQAERSRHWRRGKQGGRGAEAPAARQGALTPVAIAARSLTRHADKRKALWTAGVAVSNHARAAGKEAPKTL